MNTYLEFKETENLRPLKLQNKEKYYFDLENIENSWSGRADLFQIANTFIMEAEQQLRNALELFELGYFDCAYYSLRSAVDISTTIVFLADMPDADRENYTGKWKSTEDFPMQGQMLKLLSAHGDTFVDMKQQMPQFFQNAKSLSAELNKYVHKQGFQHFYVSRNHPINMHKPLDPFITEFEKYFKRCAGVVAVMRLAIDPFPVLLMDEEIMYRCFDAMTIPYGKTFVDEYIGEDTINAYKLTTLYTGMYEHFMSIEKKNDNVFNVTKHQYIDTREKDSILTQAHLMTNADVICTLLVCACEKIVKVYVDNGLTAYFTERKTNRKKMSWSSAQFTQFANAEELINQTYDEAYISVCHFGESIYWLEHNEQLCDADLNCIRVAFFELRNYLHTEDGDN